MRIELRTKDFKTGLEQINRYKARYTKPILQDVRISYHNAGAIRLEATDLESSMMWIVPVKGISTDPRREGEPHTYKNIVVSYEKLFAMVKKIKAETLILSDPTGEGKIIKLEAGKQTFELLQDDPEEFPMLPHKILMSDQAIGIKSQDLLDKIISTSFAVAKDMSWRYAYNGLYFELVEGKKVLTVGTDGRRLAVAGPHDDGKALHSFVVPMKAITILAQALKKREDYVVRIDPIYHTPAKVEGAKEDPKPVLKYVCFDVHGLFQICARPLEGDYPHFRDCIPSTAGRLNLLLDRAEVIEAVDTVNVTAGHGVRQMDIEIDQDDKLTFTTKQEGIGATTYKLDKVSMGMISGTRKPVKDYCATINPDFLLDYFKTFDKTQKNLEIFIEDNQSAVLVMGTDGDDSFYVLMPITGK